MSLFLGILLTLVVLLLVVMIHEIGHFVTARLTGMRVEEFGIGIPPRARALYTDKKGTEYSLNWLPIGGFVRILGENPQDADNHKK
jgi:regulator of sigma E protease